jgi:hypothetical protein
VSLKNKGFTDWLVRWEGFKGGELLGNNRRVEFQKIKLNAILIRKSIHLCCPFSENQNLFCNFDQKIEKALETLSDKLKLGFGSG